MTKKKIKSNSITNSITKHKLFKSAKKNIKSKKTITVFALIVVLVILAISFNLNRFSTEGDVAATVNGKQITTVDLDNRYDFLFFLMGYPESYKELIPKESFLEQLVNEELLLQEAAKTKIIVLDKDVDAELERLIEQSPVSKEEFEMSLVEAGFAMKDLQDYYKRQMIITELLDESLADAEISDEEAKEYYENNDQLYGAKEGQIRLRHILVETEEEAEGILTELKKGKNFAELAEEKSTGPSSVNGGDLGFVSKGQMVPEFEEVAFELNVNQLSGVVETQFGFHVIKRESSKVTFTDAKESIKDTLSTEKQREIVGVYIDGLKESADIVMGTSGSKEGNTETVEGGVSVEPVDESCYADDGLTANTVVFFHADWCPYCQQMAPIVGELVDEGYDFFYAETTSGDGVDVVNKCFGDVLQGGIPQFICAGSKNFLMGAMSKSELKAFADSC